jgi:hypothetical protein
MSGMFLSCWFRVKLTAKHLFLRFYLHSAKKFNALSNAPVAAALTQRPNVRGLNTADCRAGRETFSHYYCMDYIELGEDKLTVRTLRLKLLTGPFRLDQLLYLERATKSVFKR